MRTGASTGARFGRGTPRAEQPAAIVNRDHVAFAGMLRDPAFIADLRRATMEPFPADPRLAAAPRFLAGFGAELRRKIEAAGVRID